MKQYCLSNSNINLVCEEIGDFLIRSDVESREVLRAKLTFEELLLEYQAKFGEDDIFEVRCSKRLSCAKVEIIVSGEAYDPMSRDDEEADLTQSILAKMGVAPSWDYKKGKNYLVLFPKKKPLSGMVKMAIAVMLSVVAGLVLSVIPDAIRGGVSEYLLTPVADAFLGLIAAVSGPLIFLTVLGSICGMGNIETLGKIGGKTIKMILIHIFVIGIAMTAVGSLFFHVEWSGKSGASFSQILDLIYDIVPTSFFEPFITGNALQLVFIAIIVGLAMLVLATRVKGVFQIAEQISTIMQTIMSGVSSMLPILIFVIFTKMISNGNLKIMISAWKMILMTVSLIAGYYILNLLRIAITKKVSPILLFKKGWPTFAICLATASSAAAFATNVRDSKEKLGIDKKLVDFASPIGQVLFKPALIAMLFAMETGLAEIYGITITVPWLIMGLAISTLLSFSVPPVPGGATVCFTIAFTQAGIPLEAIGIALAVTAVCDFISTAAHVSSWQLNMIGLADSLDMLDKETLKKKC